jgi:signal transduction histidine kinase
VAELELSLLKKRTNYEYEETIKRALIDTKRLVRLSNGLLDLAKASYDQTEISIKEVRLDELLMEAREAVLRSNPTYKVNIIFEREIEDADFISVKGNEYLLRVAFINLIENGCKFSEDHQSTVAISYFDNKSILRFSDRGVGISEDEQSDIFTAFYRGRNKTVAEGNGIGLSLTKKIVLLHKGKIVLASKTGEGTSFTIELPNIEAVVSN